MFLAVAMLPLHRVPQCADLKTQAWCAKSVVRAKNGTAVCATSYVRERCFRTCTRCRPSDPHTAELLDLGTRHRTDKVDHGFLEVYAERFGPIRGRVRRVLEVGVFFGASILLWRDFFPRATVYGLDTFEGVLGVAHTHGKLRGERVTSQPGPHTVHYPHATSCTPSLSVHC